MSSSASIRSVKARRVWDSRGRPTIEAEVTLASGATGRAIAPAGASKGSDEAVDKRDGGEPFGGLDVRLAVAAVNGEIASALDGLDARHQAAIDAAMIDLDGTAQKSRLGGNALVAVSMAVLHAAAAEERLPLWHYLAGDAEVTLPMPQIQIFGGGAHAARRIDIQDFLVICPKASSFTQALDWTAEVYRAAGALLAEQGKLQGVADEGGYWPAFYTNEAALEALVHAIERAGFHPGEEVAIALDIAASNFGRKGRYTLGLEGRSFDTGEMVDQLADFIQRYPILSIEDPAAEDDEVGFTTLTRRVGTRCQVVGDDFLVTNADRVRLASVASNCTAVLLKPNQAGTITETKAALDAAKSVGFGTIVSARSGESEDVTIAHLAVGWNAGQFKVGSFSRSERMAKWNEMLRIEEALGDRAQYAGGSALRFSKALLT